MKRLSPLSALLLFVSAVTALDCSGPADIVIAVPGSPEAVPNSEFQLLEDFLTKLVRYYNIDNAGTRVGLILYGREPKVISGLEDSYSLQALNARITLLSQRQLYSSGVYGGQNVPKALDKMREIFSNSGRGSVPRIGVMMTYGSLDLTSSNPSAVAGSVAAAGKKLLDQGVHMFATSSNGTVPGFPSITMDTCRLFSLGTWEGFGSLLPYLASAVCYILDPSVGPTPLNCFPVLQQPFADVPYTCPTPSGFHVDPDNCAYYYHCPHLQRLPCPPNTLYDPAIQSCNHKDAVTCYSGITCPQPFGLFPHPRDCGKFVSCWENVPYIEQCPADLVFNPLKFYCDYKEAYKCQL